MGPPDKEEAVGTNLKRTLLVMLAIAAMAFVAACGDDEGDSGSAGGSSASAATSSSDCGSDAAKAEVAKLSERPTDIGITEPIEGGMPKGKSFAYVQGPYPDAVQIGDEYEKLAKVVGWKFHRIAADGTPEQVKAAWAEAVRLKPDGIIQGGGGWPEEPYKAEVEEAKAAGIKLVGFSETHDGDPWDVAIAHGEGFAKTGFGDVAAAVAAANIKDGDKVLSLNLPGIGLVKAQVDEFVAQLKKLCPKSEVEIFDVPLSSLGKDAPVKIASHLQANPDYKFMYLTTIDLAVGLDAAYKSAGVTPPPTVAVTTTKAGLESLAKGEAGLIGTAHFPSLEGAYRSLDALGRLFAGQSVDGIQDDTIPRWLVTKDNIPAGEVPLPASKDYKQQFFKLWGIDG